MRGATRFFHFALFIGISKNQLDLLGKGRIAACVAGKGWMRLALRS